MTLALPHQLVATAAIAGFSVAILAFACCSYPIAVECFAGIGGFAVVDSSYPAVVLGSKNSIDHLADHSSLKTKFVFTLKLQIVKTFPKFFISAPVINIPTLNQSKVYAKPRSQKSISKSDTSTIILRKNAVFFSKI